MDWYNEPPRWSDRGDVVMIQSGPATDFWRVTYNGAVNDNGHFYYQRQTGDFQADVKISGDYRALYDQAGLMVRLDASHWIKCGIEFVDGFQHASAVVTRDYSDWSIVRLENSPPSFWLRVLRRGPTVEISYALDGRNYQLLRQAYFTLTETLDVGLMCASPRGSGFSSKFEQFRIQSL